MSRNLDVMLAQCKTCPFREDGWTDVRELLIHRALNEATPICHSTGSTALTKKVSSRQKLCRGARNFQLQVFAAIGFIEAPTDAAWNREREKLA